MSLVYNTSDLHLVTELNGVKALKETESTFKLEDGLLHLSMDEDTFAASTACCDLDLLPPESNQ